MFCENLKAIRKSKGLSQEELASKLNVVRQTVSKWEQGLSVPDSDLLLVLSEVLETPVGTLLGETVVTSKEDEYQSILEQLERISLQLAKRKDRARRILRGFFIGLCAFTVTVFAALIVLNSPYLGWDYGNPEIAVAGVAFHAFEWLFVRIAPILLMGGIAGIILTRRKA